MGAQGVRRKSLGNHACLETRDHARELPDVPGAWGAPVVGVASSVRTSGAVEDSAADEEAPPGGTGQRTDGP
jgi:hypothetical protein